MTYHNHCSLHRAACNLARPLSPRHPGLCRDGREEQEQEQEQEQEEHQTPVALPSKFKSSLTNSPSDDQFDIAEACFENDRNRLREFIMSWFDLSSSSQQW